MSLIDALLLEPCPLKLSDCPIPHELWIAARTDGIKGSGTLDDPYDGSSRLTPVLSIASLTKGTPDPTEATAVTADNHGFGEGDMVTIFAPAGSGDRFYNGTFPI